MLTIRHCRAAEWKLDKPEPRPEVVRRPRYPHGRPPPVRWTPEQDAKLRVLWVSGKMVNEIAEELGVTKNAAVGRAWRLELGPCASSGPGLPWQRRRK